MGKITNDGTLVTKNTFGLMENIDGKAWAEMRAKVFSKHLLWEVNTDPGGAVLYPYKSIVDGQQWVLRVNDFPAEPLYTLLIDDKPAITIDALPPTTWKILEEGVQDREHCGNSPK